MFSHFAHFHSKFINTFYNRNLTRLGATVGSISGFFYLTDHYIKKSLHFNLRSKEEIMLDSEFEDLEKDFQIFVYDCLDNMRVKKNPVSYIINEDAPFFVNFFIATVSCSAFGYYYTLYYPITIPLTIMYNIIKNK